MLASKPGLYQLIKINSTNINLDIFPTVHFICRAILVHGTKKCNKLTITHFSVEKEEEEEAS